MFTLNTVKKISKSKIVPLDSVSFTNSKWIHTLFLPKKKIDLPSNPAKMIFFSILYNVSGNIL